ncbi:MAG: transglutaminase domain-containing protein [Alphaproteobacteria bacterium]
MNKSNIKLVLITIILITSCFYVSVESRWAVLGEVPYVCDFYEQRILIDEEGKSKSVTEIQFKINDYRENYDWELYLREGGSFKLLDGKIINGFREYKILPESITEKEVEDEDDSFYKWKLITIPLPDMHDLFHSKNKKSSKIYLKYRVTQNHPILKKEVSLKYHFGKGAYWKKGRLVIDSKLPLYLEYNDPSGSLFIKKEKEDLFYKATIELLNPISHDLVNENDEMLDHRDLTWVSVSTIKDWEDFGRKMAKKYEKVIKQPLPQNFYKILEETQKQKKEVHQLNAIQKHLHGEHGFLYEVTTSNLKRSSFPQNMKKIAQSKKGDCKDYSAFMVSILRHLGYKANVALVEYGVLKPSKIFSLPYAGSFNHVIVKVIGKTGKTYWSDPTEQSFNMEEGFPPALAGKMALVLDERIPTYEQIPQNIPEHCVKLIKTDIDVQQDGSINIKSIQTIKKQAMNLPFHINFFPHEVSKIETLNLWEKNPKERLQKYEEQNVKGEHILSLSNPLFSILSQYPDDSVGNLYVSGPMQLEKQIHVKNRNIKNCETLRKKIDFPWLSVERLCDNEGQGGRVIETLIIKTQFISKKDRETFQYKALVNSIQGLMNENLDLT